MVSGAHRHRRAASGRRGKSTYSARLIGLNTATDGERIRAPICRQSLRTGSGIVFR